MAYTIRHTINLGVGENGKTLAAQLYNDAGEAVGDPITTGFTDRGNGVYWFVCSIPDSFGGFIDIIDTTEPDDVIDSVAINPQDAEYSHTAEQAGEAAASKILATPANKLASNDSGQVEASNIYSLTPIP